MGPTHTLVQAQQLLGEALLNRTAPDGARRALVAAGRGATSPRSTWLGGLRTELPFLIKRPLPGPERALNITEIFSTF